MRDDPARQLVRLQPYSALHQQLESGAIFSDPLALKILDPQTAAALDELSRDESIRPMRLFIGARSRLSEATIRKTGGTPAFG